MDFLIFFLGNDVDFLKDFFKGRGFFNEIEDFLKNFFAENKDFFCNFFANNEDFF